MTSLTEQEIADLRKQAYIWGEKLGVEMGTVMPALIGYQHLKAEDIKGHVLSLDGKPWMRLIRLMVDDDKVFDTPSETAKEHGWVNHGWWFGELLDFDLWLKNEGVMPEFPKELQAKKDKAAYRRECISLHHGDLSRCSASMSLEVSDSNVCEFKDECELVLAVMIREQQNEQT